MKMRILQIQDYIFSLFLNVTHTIVGVLLTYKLINPPRNNCLWAIQIFVLYKGIEPATCSAASNHLVIALTVSKTPTHHAKYQA